jgi:two-component system chemotaxis response regulator CheB
LTSEQTPRQHLVVVGASAGGVEALRELVAALPGDFPAVMLVVLHVAPAGTSVLPQILDRAGRLPALSASDGALLKGGHIYIAPPDCHLTVDHGHMLLTRGPSVNGHRPAIDPLFRSAAEAHGTGVAGVILSGVLDDGTAGLASIKEQGGRTLVQDPEEALYKGMPTAAIEHVSPDLVAPVRELALALAEAAAPPPDGHFHPAEDSRDPNSFVEVDRGASERPHPGATTGFSCPICNGAIWESVEGGREVYRCRIGHEFTAEAFLSEQNGQVEQAMWTALRALEEQAALHRRLAERMRERGAGHTAAHFARRADEKIEQAVILRDLLESDAREEEAS